MSKEEQLKPCPFCGGPATIEENPAASVDPNSVSFSISCDNPKIDDCPGYMTYHVHSRRSDAIKAWNRRVQS